MDADLVIVRARLRPGPDGADAGSADALAVRGGRIVAVGRSAEIGRTPAATVLDLDGRVLAPGLVDAHNHLSLYAILRRQVDCRVPLGGDLDEILGRLGRTVDTLDTAVDTLDTAAATAVCQPQLLA